jgi:hypothetical protein
MGWKTDWLYGLIFAEVESLWSKVQSEADRRHDPDEQAPDFLVVRESGHADWDDPSCKPPVLREWVYDGRRFAAQPPSSFLEPLAQPPRRGMFWDRGWFCFHIAPDRERVLITYVVGPRYGRGYVLRVEGQGPEQGRLVPDPEANSWIS